MKFIYPVKFIGICTYFNRITHKGIDLYTNSTKECKIYSAGEGTVCKVHDNDKTRKSWGNYVKIYHGSNMYTLYAHLKEGIPVKEGQKVTTRTCLGIMGNTGYSYGRHLHFEVYDGGSRTKNRKDPQKYTYAVKNYHTLSIKPKARKNIKWLDENEKILIEYKVKKGDNLSKIAKKYNIAWQNIYNQNKDVIGLNPNIIKIGQVLTFYID